MKKSIAIAVLITAVLLLIVACARQEAPAPAPAATPAAGQQQPAAPVATPAPEAGVTVAREGLPIVPELGMITLRGLVSQNVNVTDWNELPALLYLEQLTNIQIEWDSVPDAGFAERRNLLFATGDLPDFVMRAMLSSEMETNLVAAGQIIKLDDLIANYAPNLRALMESNPGLIRNMAFPDGHIYTLPQINYTEGNLINKAWINHVWLDNLGLPMPTTMDELFDTLVAFRDNDANGTGLNNEIPLSESSTGRPMYHLNRLLGAFGFGGNHGVFRQFFDVDDNGQVRVIVMDPDYLAFLEFWHRLWAEDLMDREIFSQERPALVAKITDNRVGFTLAGNNHLWKGANRDYFTQPPALIGPRGHSYWPNVASNVQMTGTFAITSVNPYPEATMRWVDHLYSEEGTALVRFGIEGETWFFNDEGRRELKPHISNCPDGLTQDQAIGRWTFFGGGNVPQFITDAVDASAAQLPEIRAITELLRPNLVPYANIPRLVFTEQEANDISIFGRDIETFIDENIVLFITGEKPLSDFDNFIAELERINIEGFRQILQDAFDRWMALG